MLEELHVAGLGVIDEASIEFGPGLNVLTGETGAGKTLVTIALSLALGARAGSGLVRAGGGALVVEARFAVDEMPPRSASQDRTAADEAAAETAAEWAEWIEDGALVLARVMREDGRGSARASGHLVPVSTLAALGSTLTQIHGQRQADRLLHPAAQTELLDRFAGPDHLDVLAEYRTSHAGLRAARSRLEVLDGNAREREREKDLLGYQVREIEAAAISLGEIAALREEESRLAHAERIIELAGATEHAIGADGGAADRLREAASALGGAATVDAALALAAARAASLVAEAEDLLSTVRAHRDSVGVNPLRLEAVRERIQAIGSLERKYGEGEEGILAYLAEARTSLASVEAGEDERAGLETEAARRLVETEVLSERLGVRRRSAGPALANAVTAELQELGMPGARVVVAIESEPALGCDGAERASILFSGGPGQPGQPMSQVASGGELARTMLAFRSVLADLDSIPTLVFDEVDAGIGGRAAAAVGRRLADLASGRQVLVVTHLAQIAAHADRHFLVTKEGGTAEIRALGGRDRPAEIARMLSGTVNEVSLAHARELLRAAADERTAAAPASRATPPRSPARGRAGAGRTG